MFVQLYIHNFLFRSHQLAPLQAESTLVIQQLDLES
jgi:hypothetical protein